MQLLITKQQLQRAIGSVSRLASAKMPLPILSNILLEVKESQLSLSVTNLELGISTTIPIEGAEEGQFTVPARLFTEFVQQVTDPLLTLKVTDNATLLITSDHASAKIRGLDASEFPGLPFTDDEPTVTFAAQDLKSAIDLVLFSTALDDTRPVLGGVYWTARHNELILASTDGYRLAEKRLKTSRHDTSDCSAIVPKQTLLELSRILSDTPGDISVIVGDNQIQFRSDFVRVVSRLIEGNYPSYEAIIPNSYQTRVTAHAGDLATGLKTAQLFARDTGNVVKLNIQPGGGLTIEAVSDARGEAQSQLTAITEGEGLSIAFNVKYLLDALSVIQSDNVFLELSSPDRPVVIRPSNTKDYFSLVMPLKID